MDQIGLLHKIIDSAERIDEGRKWQNTIGLESNGRVSYQLGLTTAMDAFQSVQTQAMSNLELTMLAEKAFVTQELQLSDSSDTQTISSLEKAIKSFDDALRSLEVVSNSISYIEAEKTYPTNGKHRYKDMPKDAFHVACIAHRTRIGNILRAPGISMAEKQLLNQRAANMATAQSIYLDKQKTALGV